jgi:hypothetical protein
MTQNMVPNEANMDCFLKFVKCNIAHLSPINVPNSSGISSRHFQQCTKSSVFTSPLSLSFAYILFEDKIKNIILTSSVKRTHNDEVISVRMLRLRNYSVI